MDTKNINDLWKVNLLRFTIFPAGQFAVSNSWWETLTGKLPENINNQPQFQTMHFEGTYESGNFVIETDPIRINLIYTQNLLNQTNNIGFFNLTEYDFINPIFNSLVDKWLSMPDCPTAQRIAFGGTLLAPVNTKEDGYSKLSNFLHSVKIDPENSFDFLYQINRPKKSTSVPFDIKINRLSKWICARLQTNLTSFFPVNPQQYQVNDEFAVSLEFDINTDQASLTKLSSESQKKLFTEFQTFLQEIAINGDI